MEILEKKEELKKKRAVDKLLNNPEVISDVIFWFIYNKNSICRKDSADLPVYYNAMTDKEGDTLNSVIREERRYIVKIVYSCIDIETTKKMVETYGFHMHIDEQENVVRLFFTKFSFSRGKWRWSATDEGIITKDGKCSIGPPKGRKAICNMYDDICGQYIENQYEFSVGRVNICGGAVETLCDFFGAFPYFSDSSMPYNVLSEPFITHQNAINIIEMLHEDNVKRKIHTGEKIYVGDDWYGYVDNVDIPDAPKEALETIKDVEMKRTLTEGFPATSVHRYNIVHKIGDCVYQRFFFAFIYFDCHGSMQIRLSEYKVIKLTRHIYEDSRKMMLGDTVWCDDLEGTFIEYTGKYIAEWMQYIRKYLYEDTTDFNGEPEREYKGKNPIVLSIKSMKSDFGPLWMDKEKDKYRSKYNFSNALCVYMAVVAAYNPVIEMFLNFGEKEEEEFRMEVASRLVTRSKVPTATLNEMFGRIYWRAKTPDKALGLPKGTLKFAVGYSNMAIYVLKSIREAFSISKEGRQYLKRMNRTDFKYLIDLWEIKEEDFEEDLVFEILARLIKFFGVRRWKKYIEYLKSADFLEDPDSYAKYKQYLDMLYVLGDDVKKTKWCLTGKEFPVLFDELITLVAADKDKGEFGKLMKKWEPMCQKYEQEYAFSENGLKIVVPKTPGELVREGILLEHCGGTFIKKMAEKKTVILFIRRQGDENTPYYTLEIRDNEVRQCHGKNNINVTVNVNQFLKEFCDDKKIIYNDGHALLNI